MTFGAIALKLGALAFLRKRFRKTSSPRVQAMTVANSARDRRDWPEAVAAYGLALSVDDQRANVWVQYGHALKETENLTEAINAYDRAIILAPEDPDAYLHKGNALKALGQLEAAADTYVEAARLDPQFDAPRRELRHLAHRGVESALPMPSRRPSAARPHGGAQIVFDISDLIGYFDNARLPTGIQRVQMEVIAALCRDASPDRPIDICSFSQGRDKWIDINPDHFLEIVDLALLSGERDDEWSSAVDSLKEAVDLGSPITFRQNATLVNLGTSWWLQNYFLHVRQIQDLYGVRYIPFVHDMIPIVAPEHCLEALTQDFISWALGVFAHANAYFANSESSKRDLIAVGKTLGHTINPENVHVVRLDADFRRPVAPTSLVDTAEKYGLNDQTFVLFVSTIESRKNHLLVLRAWRRMIERHGIDHTPALVCVGNRGWKNDATFAFLDANDAVRAKVVMLSGVSDGDLANLYQACLFTVYPSLYEGWGLPVTESLSNGKPVILSNSSSLPEAGGALGVYFRHGDLGDLTAKLEAMTFDAPYRTALSRRIKDTFKPRAWRDLSAEITGQIKKFDYSSDLPSRPQHATPGRYYSLQRSLETTIHPGMIAGEIFRIGDGWFAPEAWGCWTKARSSRLAFHLAEAPPHPTVYVGLVGLPGKDAAYSIFVNDAPSAAGQLLAGERHWQKLALPRASNEAIYEIRIESSDCEDLSVGSNGVDLRTVSIGVLGFMTGDETDLDARIERLDAETAPQG